MSRPVRVLLLWPGTLGPGGGNFGVPQLVGLATYVRHATGAQVTVVDLSCEPALGPVSIPSLLDGEHGSGYDVVGLACYSSYDWLKSDALARLARDRYPNAVICAGGYHVSARPHEVVYDGSPFDVAIVGEGEKPLRRVVESVQGGAPLRGVVLGPDPVHDLDGELPPTDWSFLDRYRSIARRVASQAEIYLSRGCPFDCAFCMERAKREVSWRSLSIDRAMDELHRLDAWLDLSGWTLYVADALFGMRGAWRKELLERMAQRPVRARQLWLLIRVDMVDDEDLRLFGAARCGLGFGLESGDPTMLATARKAGRLDTYLDRMRHVAAKARELDVPWGANVIVGHPGETEASMRTSAAFLRELFCDPRGTSGFLSIDPYRFYPGSPIDGELPWYEATYGTKVHRPRWWNDGDQEFLSEWVDPSRELTYRRRVALTEELFAPILREVPAHFVHRGSAADYFRRAVDEQIENHEPAARLHYADRYYAWQRYLGMRAAGERERLADTALESACREAREPAVRLALERAGLVGSHPARPAIEEALRAVRRELFVPLDEVRASVDDAPVLLDSSGMATVSALHAYARSFSLAGVKPGARVLDLGAGAGYGTALLLRLVGPSGAVRSVEADPALVDRARSLLGDDPRASIECGDARDPASWGDLGGARRYPFDAVVVGFALPSVPASWSALAEGACVVVPLGPAEGPQVLTRLVRRADDSEPFSVETFDSVRYVPARGVVARVPAPPAPALETAPRRLPLVR